METYKKIAELRKQYYKSNPGVMGWLEMLEEKYGETFMGWAPTGGDGPLSYPNIFLQGPSTKSLSETYAFNTVNSDSWYGWKSPDEIGDSASITKINYLISFKLTKTNTTGNNYFLVGVTSATYAGASSGTLGGSPHLPTTFSGLGFVNDNVSYYTNGIPTQALVGHFPNNVYQIREYYDTQTSSLVLQQRYQSNGVTSAWVNMTNYNTSTPNRRLFIGMDQTSSVTNSYTVTMIPNI